VPIPNTAPRVTHYVIEHIKHSQTTLEIFKLNNVQFGFPASTHLYDVFEKLQPLVAPSAITVKPVEQNSRKYEHKPQSEHVDPPRPEGAMYVLVKTIRKAG
jgi:hypothetical protein